MQQGVVPISFRHLALVLIISLAVHFAFAVTLFWQTPSAGTPSTGVGGTEIGLGMAGAAPGTVEEAPAPQEEPEIFETAEVTEQINELEVSEQAPLVEVPLEAVETPVDVIEEPVEEVEAEIPLELDAEAPVEVTPETVEAKPVDPVEEQVEAVVQEVVARKVPEPPQAKPVPPKKPEPLKKEAVKAKQPEPARPAEPEEIAEALEQTAEPTTMPGQITSVAGSDGQSGTKSASATGSGNSTSGGGQPGAAADFTALIQAWLEKHKKYPRRARTRRQQGTAILSFVMDRKGNVLDYHITKSSGHKLLDTEVAAMIERANPLPTMPDDMDSGRLEVVVPVAFFLR